MTQKKGTKSARWNARIRRLRHRDERGVSPIIATILLVAITVVLAAVLYILVAGLTKTGVTAPSALEMSKTGTMNCVLQNCTETIALQPTSGLLTSMVALGVTNITGGTWKVGTVPTTTCFPKATPATAQSACNNGVSSGWFAYLVYNSYLYATYGKNSTTNVIQWNYATGTTNLALVQSDYLTIVFWALTNPSGSNTLAATGTGSTVVTGSVAL